MRVYVAGKFRRRLEIAEFAERVIERGHSITHAWWNEEDPPPDVTPAEKREFFQVCAAADVDGVLTAEVVILIHDPHCRGAFVEFGLALAEGVHVIVVDGEGDPAQAVPIFYVLPEVEHVPTKDAALDALDAWARRAA